MAGVNEMGKLMEDLPYLDRDIITEIYRSLKTSERSIFNEEVKLTERLSAAVAFCQLMHEDPDYVTDFHKRKLASLFDKRELHDLSKLINSLLGAKIDFPEKSAKTKKV